mgnify:CR=1 FL=1
MSVKVLKIDLRELTTNGVADKQNMCYTITNPIEK